MQYRLIKKIIIGQVGIIFSINIVFITRGPLRCGQAHEPQCGCNVCSYSTERERDNASCGHRQPLPLSRNSRKDSPRLPSSITQILNENLPWRWMLPVLGLVRFSPNDMVILPNYTLVLFTHANSPPRNRIMMWAIDNC